MPERGTAKRSHLELVTSTVRTRIWRMIEVSWAFSTGLGVLYLLVVYLLPLARIIQPVPFPFKFTVEVLVCGIAIGTSMLLTLDRMRDSGASISIDEDMLILRANNRLIGTSCLDIISAPGSVRYGDGERPEYDTTFLLALRAGMDDRVTMAYEVGVQNEEPFLRIFITASGKNLDEIANTLRREATRTEAILLASLNTVELTQLNGLELRDAVFSYMKSTAFEGHHSVSENLVEHQTLLVIDGEPRIMPSIDSSQVGTFISTTLKQGYSASLTCVFSRAKQGKERRKLEGEWKSIRAKEKRSEDSLADQAAKKQLLRHYEKIQGKDTWFNVTVTLIVKADTSELLQEYQEGLSGLVYSVWGGDGTIELKSRSMSQRAVYRLLMRRHLRPKRMHVSRLAAFVNTPVQQLPVIASAPVPSFAIPSKEQVDKDLIIGKAVFGGRQLIDVGLEIEWLREHVAVLGATGTGKTTLVKHLMRELSTKSEVPWWVFDVKGSEYLDLVNVCHDDLVILRPGLDPSFVIDLMDSEVESDEKHAHTTFAILKELLKERSASSELTPSMERMLRNAVLDVAKSKNHENSIQALVQRIVELAGDDRIGKMTRDALLNRLEILSREPLGSILRGGANAVKVSELMEKRVIFDLHHVAMVGGMEAARVLYNLVAKRIFDFALYRGITPGLQHLVVLEEASNLVPESYSRNTAADVTTGESMVMLLRATGQGVVVISTRPNISSNILANTSTKITFRLPYDSSLGGRFMSLEENQERYLRTLKRGRALVVLPGTETFEMATHPFESKPLAEIVVAGQAVAPKLSKIESEVPITAEQTSSLEDSTIGISEVTPIEKKSTVFDRFGELGTHVVAFLASRNMATQGEIHGLLATIDSRISDEDINEVIRDLVSLGTIEREALSLVRGGFVFTLPGRGLDAVRTAITEYVVGRLGTFHNIQEPDRESDLDLLIDDKAVLILPEHLKASSMGSTLQRIKGHMAELGNNVSELIIIVRGSVAAAKLRELMDSSEDFNAVSIVSAFPSSLNTMIETFAPKSKLETTDVEQTQLDNVEEEGEQVGLIGAMHEVGSATSRAIQMRLWFQLMQDFIDLSEGRVEWPVLLEFIETTAMQSLKGRSAPMNAEEGKRALTELLADEVLVAVRVGEGLHFVDLTEGLWVLNSAVLGELRDSVVEALALKLKKGKSKVFRGHGYYDLCANGISYVVFPNQQQLNTLLHLQSNVACRTCKSKRVVCVLTAAEYLEDNMIMPENIQLFDFSEYVSVASATG